MIEPQPTFQTGLKMVHENHRKVNWTIPFELNLRGRLAVSLLARDEVSLFTSRDPFQITKRADARICFLDFHTGEILAPLAGIDGGISREKSAHPHHFIHIM